MPATRRRRRRMKVGTSTAAYDAQVKSASTSREYTVDSSRTNMSREVMTRGALGHGDCFRWSFVGHASMPAPPLIPRHRHHTYMIRMTRRARRSLLSPSFLAPVRLKAAEKLLWRCLPAIRAGRVMRDAERGRLRRHFRKGA